MQQAFTLIEHSDTGDPYIFKSKVIRGYDISFELIEPRLKLGEGFIGRVAESGKSIISPDVSQDARYFAARKPTRSEMIAPIISNDKVLGVFDLESDQLNAYDEGRSRGAGANYFAGRHHHRKGAVARAGYREKTHRGTA
jgi:hypothetical protein